MWKKQVSKPEISFCFILSSPYIVVVVVAAAAAVEVPSDACDRSYLGDWYAPHLYISFVYLSIRRARARVCVYNALIE